jgi:chromosome segregation ATPase
MEVEASQIEQHCLALRQQIEAGTERVQQAEKEKKVLQKAVSLALEPSSSPSSVLQELRAQLSASEDHLTILQAEWETVKVPLEETKTELEKSSLVGKGELQEKLKQMKEMRHKLKQLSTTLRAR